MKQDSSSFLEVWNSNCGGNMYFEFVVKFEVVFEIHFEQAIYISKLGILESNASNSVQIKVKTKKLWPFEYKCVELRDHFKMILKFNF